MPDRFSFSLLCLLLVCFAAMPASAQKAPQVKGTVPAPSAEEDQEPTPEPPKSVINVEIKNDLMSVDLENVSFGTAIKAVADKAGFKIEGSGEVFTRKMNTKFADIEVERGVLRLLSLVKETNYMLHYDTNGQISKLEIFAISTVSPPGAAARQPSSPTPAFRRPAVTPTTPAAPVTPQTPQRPATVSPIPQPRRMPPVVRRRPVPSRYVQPTQPAAQPSDNAKPQPDDDNNDGEEESVDVIPYVPPQPGMVPGRKP